MSSWLKNALVSLLPCFYLLLSFIHPCYSSSVRSKPNVSMLNDNDLVMFDDQVENVDDIDDLDNNSTQVEKVRDFTSKQFNEDCLKTHNELRKSVKVAPLEISEKIVEFARKRVKQLAMENDTVILRHDPQNYGENLMAWPIDGPFRCSDVIKLWFDEYKMVSNWSDPESAGLEVYHFTQVAWRQSKLVGCGAASLEGSDWLFVSCNYYPPGNYLKEFVENVNPPEEITQSFAPNRNSTIVVTRDDGCKCICNAA